MVKKCVNSADPARHGIAVSADYKAPVLARMDFSSCIPRSTTTPRGSAAQRFGVYYERAVTKWFAARYLVAPQPAVFESARPLYPDLLVFDDACTRCIVVEIKHVYCNSSQAQLERYVRLVGLAFPWMKVSGLVVCGQTLSGLPENVMILSKRELRLGAVDGLGLAGSALAPALRELRNAGDSVRLWDGVCGVVASLRTESTRCYP